MPVNIVWLKRDLRLTDHQALFSAVQHEEPVLLFYCFEPIALRDKHSSMRHFQFIAQSLLDIKSRLPDGALYCAYGECLAVLEQIQTSVGINKVFSHQEIGLSYTFERDKQVATWCESKGIVWHEFPQGAVVRGLRARTNWDKNWQKTMRDSVLDVDIQQVNFFNETHRFNNHVGLDFFIRVQTNSVFQTGGEGIGRQVLTSFFENRGKEYAYSLSSPEKAVEHCSRLSTYLAWGNLSLRQVYQEVLKNWKKPYWRKTLIAFTSRLHWHCHFIQKFESECDMEFRCVNRAYENMPRVTGKAEHERLEAWKSGNTGVPMVDACMRSLIATGYLNFRMRAMLVSFLCHHLELDWRAGVAHLARLFLDFEPGIHYSQFQMQAGVTGINTIRIYNPVKQGEDKDPDGHFVKKWVPELSDIPAPLVHSPWTLTEMEQMMYGIELGVDYPLPVVDLKESYSKAQTLLWQWKKRDDVISEAKRVLAIHVR
nr:deoxyribodipyrimidine photo-lyase [Pseudoalteromonas luteoviolacea]